MIKKDKNQKERLGYLTNVKSQRDWVPGSKHNSNQKQKIRFKFTNQARVTNMCEECQASSKHRPTHRYRTRLVRQGINTTEKKAQAQVKCLVTELCYPKYVRIDFELCIIQNMKSPHTHKPQEKISHRQTGKDSFS